MGPIGLRGRHEGLPLHGPWKDGTPESGESLFYTLDTRLAAERVDANSRIKRKITGDSHFLECMILLDRSLHLGLRFY